MKEEFKPKQVAKDFSFRLIGALLLQLFDDDGSDYLKEEAAFYASRSFEESQKG